MMLSKKLTERNPQGIWYWDENVDGAATDTRAGLGLKRNHLSRLKQKILRWLRM